MVNRLPEKDIALEKSNDPEHRRRADTVKEVWRVYIARSMKTGRFYTGISPNPAKRLQMHNTGAGSKFARDQGPLKIVYVSDSLASKSEARKREIQIKGWRAEKKQWLIDRVIR